MPGEVWVKVVPPALPPMLPPVCTGGTVTTISGGDTLRTFLAGSSLVVTQAGFVRTLVVGAGGLAISGGDAGGGGDAEDCWLYLPIGTYPVVVGAAPVANNVVADGSSFGGIAVPGGCGGGYSPSGIGFYQRSARAWGGTRGQNNNTGGGGARGDGTGSVGGPGFTSNITGTQLEYGRGGFPNSTASVNYGDGGSKNSITPKQGVVYVRHA